METENTSKQNLDKLLVLFPNIVGRLRPETKDGNGSGGSNGHGTAFLFSFLGDLVRCMKGSLLSINNLACQAVEKFDSHDMRQHFQTSVAQDVKKIDSVLNTLLNYMSVTTPLVKTNTLNIILEEVLEANEKQLRDRKIHTFKNCEADLPQTYMHTEQVRFVLNSLLQYAILYTPPDGNIGFSIKLLNPSSSVGPVRTNPAYVGVSIGFSGSKSGRESPGNGSGGNGSGTKEVQKDEAIELILKLVREMVERNHGTLKFIADEKGIKTLITLKLSLERRKAIHYEPINI